jgi:hypothetical protein
MFYWLSSRSVAIVNSSTSLGSVMKFELAEERLTLKEVAKLARVHLATVWRWTLVGVRGKRLRTVLLGGRRWVLQRDLDQFLTEESQTMSQVEPTARAKRVEEQLYEAGF